MCVLRGGHPRNGLESAGKVMNGGKVKLFADLGEVQPLLTNEELSTVDLHSLKMLHSSAAYLVLEELLQ